MSDYSDYFVSPGTASCIVMTSNTAISQAITYSETTETEIDRVVSIMSREKLMEILKGFEQKYNMSSKEFYDKWSKGDAPKAIDSMKWAVLWEIWREGYLI